MTSEYASAVLSALLSEPGRARAKWVRRTRRQVVGGVSFAAVATVLAEHLWESGEVTDTDVNLPRRLRDRTRRALVGEQLTWETLTWFMDAFDLVDEDRHRLAVAMERPETTSHLANAADSALPVRSRYRTVAATEHHYVGPDRVPVRHMTTQVLRGTGSELGSYLYMFDTNTIEVRARQGARAVGPIRQIRDDVFGVDIELLRPLRDGQTATLTYESIFSYTTPPEPEFRRAALEGVKSLDIRVEFHPDAIPARVLFAEWAQLGHHEPSQGEVVPIEDDLSVHRFLEAVDNSIVGFRWLWND